ncbi:MAG: hypothetical protein WC725_04635 [Patescibacteria group bacterium]|jgi:hypothetical protein
MSKKFKYLIVVMLFIAAIFLGWILFATKTPPKQTPKITAVPKFTAPVEVKIESIKPSPFTQLISLNNENKTTPSANPIPNMPPIPNGTFPVNQEMPVMPKFDTKSNSLPQIQAIIIDSGQTLAILSDGTKTATVTKGFESPWGTIDNITNEGVSINGSFIAVSRQMRTEQTERQKQESNKPAPMLDPTGNSISFNNTTNNFTPPGTIVTPEGTFSPPPIKNQTK